MRLNQKNQSRNTDPLEIEATDLKEKLDNGEDIFILDVRTQEEHDVWRLSYDKYQNTPVIPIDKFANSQNLLANTIPKDKEIVTLCAHGMRSHMAAQVLSKLGYKVKSIKGGMAAWNQVYDAIEIKLDDIITQDQSIKIWQLRRVSKGCMSYVIAYENAATVIDSTCDLDNSILQLVEENDLKIVNVIDTHMHADHVSGLSTLVAKTGATAYISAKEGYEYDSTLGIKPILINDGEKIPISNSILLTAIHAPGHTEGSMCFLLTLELGNRNKNYLFTGDVLFVNGVGRPDLHDKAKEFAIDLHNTYHDKILKYPDDTVILPAHFDTASITVQHGELVADTIGFVKRNIKLLSMSENDFVDFITTSVTPRPANYKMIIQINKKLTSCNQINTGYLEEGPNSCAIRM